MLSPGEEEVIQVTTASHQLTGTSSPSRMLLPRSTRSLEPARPPRHRDVTGEMVQRC